MFLVTTQWLVVKKKKFFFRRLKNTRHAILTKARVVLLFPTQDMHSRTETGLTPEKDVSQDYELLASFQNISHTSIVFRRAWDTCDARDDVLFGVRKTRIFLFLSFSLRTYCKTLL